MPRLLVGQPEGGTKKRATEAQIKKRGCWWATEAQKKRENL